MTLGGVSDLHIQAQEDCAAAFVSGRMDEPTLRHELSRLIDAYEIEYHVDALRAERAKRRRWDIVGVVAFVAFIVIVGWMTRGVP